MRALLHRAIVVLAVAPCLILGPVLPPEHVHDAHLSHGSPVAHRHVEVRQRATLHPSVERNQGTPEVGDHDEHVVWVAGVGISQTGFQLSVAWVLLERAAIATPATAAAARRSAIDSSPPHGPPHSIFSLRGPPLASA